VPPRKQRIVILTSSFPPKSGGIAASHYNIYLLLRDHFDVHVVAFDDDEEGDEPDVSRGKCTGFLAGAIKLALGMYLRKYGRDATCRCTLKIVQIAAMFRLRFNRIIKQFDPDFILAPDNNLPAYALRKPANSKLIWFCRNNYARFRDHPLLTNMSWLDVDLATSMERRALVKADAVVCPSRYMVNEYSKSFPVNVPITTINNFLFRSELESLEPFPIHRELGINSGTPVVYLPSAGTINKGARYLFEIVRRISKTVSGPVAFYISGFIPRDLQYELDSLTAAAIYAPGHVARAENLPIVKACSLCVSPTLIENYSNALLESICLGIPCITFDTGGNKEIVDHGENGFITDYLDVDELVARTLTLLSDPIMYRSFANAALQKGELLTDTDRILQSFHQLFDPMSGAVAEESACDQQVVTPVNQ
jgi:glycosyltransferase involved in cell wall biosynthesis